MLGGRSGECFQHISCSLRDKIQIFLILIWFRFLGPILKLLNENLWGQGPGICIDSKLSAWSYDLMRPTAPGCWVALSAFCTLGPRLLGGPDRGAPARHYWQNLKYFNFCSTCVFAELNIWLTSNMCVSPIRRKIYLWRAVKPILAPPPKPTLPPPLLLPDDSCSHLWAMQGQRNKNVLF